MSTFAKIMVVVNLILAVLFLASAGTLHGSAESWKARHDQVVTTKDQNIQALENQVKAKSGDLDTARSENRSLDTRASTAEGQLKQLNDSNGLLMREIETKNGEIQKLTAAVTDAANSIKDQTARNEQLSNQLAQKSADLAQTKEKLKTSDENLARETARADSSEKATAAAEAANVALTNALDASNTLTAAYKAKFGALSDVAVTAAVKGVIQSASAKDDVFVLSVGSKDGVKVGYEFTVSRGSNYVTTIIVDSVFPNNAACHTKQGMKKLDAQAGDSVSTASAL